MFINKVTKKLVEYPNKVLFLAGVLYLVTWRKIFTTLGSKCWSDVLLIIRLLFAVSVSKLKPIFSAPLVSNGCEIF